jgi:hypothetical protein
VRVSEVHVVQQQQKQKQGSILAVVLTATLSFSIERIACINFNVGKFLLLR